MTAGPVRVSAKGNEPPPCTKSPDSALASGERSAEARLARDALHREAHGVVLEDDLSQRKGFQALGRYPDRSLPLVAAAGEIDNNHEFLPRNLDAAVPVARRARCDLCGRDAGGGENDEGTQNIRSAWRLMTAPFWLGRVAGHFSETRPVRCFLAVGEPRECGITFTPVATGFNRKDALRSVSGRRAPDNLLCARQRGGCVDGRIVASFFALPGRCVRYFSADSTT